MEKSALSYKCPNCGGELIFNAETQRFACSWCSSDFEQSEITGIHVTETEDDIRQREAEERFSQETDVYICTSCGAEIFCEHNTAATFCCYCHSPVALKGRLSGKYRPEMIIPFQYSRRQAEAAFKAHCMKKWFLPSDFLSASHLEKITGLYVPFWLADCDVDASIMGEATEEVTRVYNDTKEITTKRFKFDRAAKMTYMGIPADGSKQIEDSLMDAIEPYDYRLLREFDMSYLSGYYCDKYDVDKIEVLSRIRDRLEEGAKEALTGDVRRYDNLVVTSKKVRIINTKWHYMMLPVWFLTYNHHGQIYSFAMNGQTGKFAGIFPVSWVKMAAAALGVGIIAGIVIYLMGGGLL